MKVPVHKNPAPNAPPAAPVRSRSETVTAPTSGSLSLFTAARQTQNREANQNDSALFETLLGQSPGTENGAILTPVPLLLASQLPDLQEPVAEPQGVTTPPVWHAAEPQLAQSVMDAGPLPAAMTLLLPQLGPVEATLDALTGGGWDIALAFTPQAWPLVKGTQWLCGRSLEQRLGKPVLLRFMQQALA